MIPFKIGALETIPRGFGKMTRGDGNRRTSGDHPIYNITAVVLNTEKSPGDERRLSLQ